MDNKIKELLKERGMSQKDLASVIERTEITVSKYVNGDNIPRDSEERIAAALGVEVKDLYYDAPIVDRKALYEGELHLGEKTLPCAVLNDGTRIITATAVFEAFDRPRKGKSNEGYRADRMPSFINANNLQPYVDQQLMTTQTFMVRKNKAIMLVSFVGFARCILMQGEIMLY